MTNATVKILGGNGDPIAMYVVCDDGRVYRLPYGLLDRPPLTKELRKALGLDEQHVSESKD